jgi:hypothetical protein
MITKKINDATNRYLDRKMLIEGIEELPLFPW